MPKIEEQDTQEGMFSFITGLFGSDEDEEEEKVEEDWEDEQTKNEITVDAKVIDEKADIKPVNATVTKEVPK